MARNTINKDPNKLRSRKWFANPENPDMTALYLERYMNFGLTRQELQAGKPIIAIAQSGSDLSPCNRHHLELAHRVREGIREAGGIAFEVPLHPSRKPASGRPRRWIAISATWAWSNSSTVTSSTAWCSPPAVTRRRPPSSWRPRPSTSRPSCCPADPC